MSNRNAVFDERVVAVADKSCRFAYMVLAFGVLITVVVRGLAFHQACLDLLGLVFVSGMVGTFYQRAKHVQTLPGHRVLLVVLIGTAVGMATVVAAMMLLKR